MSNQRGTFMQLDDVDVMQAFKDLGELTRKDAATIITEHAVMLGRYLAESTAPFTETTKQPGVATPEELRRFDGGSKDAKMAGELATARDIDAVESGDLAIFRTAGAYGATASPAASPSKVIAWTSTRRRACAMSALARAQNSSEPTVSSMLGWLPRPIRAPMPAPEALGKRRVLTFEGPAVPARNAYIGLLVLTTTA